MPSSGLCRSGAAARVRVPVRVFSPLKQYKKSESFIRNKEFNSSTNIEINHDDLSLNCHKSGNRVIMVVIDSNAEAKGAVQWALSHAVQSQDTIILLHVVRKDGETNSNGVSIEQRAYDLLRATKNICQKKRPEVCVEIAMRQGREKGATIVETAKQLRASLLVLGHRKQSFLRRIWRRKTSGKMTRVMDYCIQNANCMTIAVRRKNRKYGGYLITTKSHKNFWLLA